MTVKSNDAKYSLQLSRNSLHKGYLPAAKIDSEPHKGQYDQGEYSLTSEDDKLHVNYKSKKIPLDEWLKNAILR